MQLQGDTGCQGRVPEMPRHYPLDTRAEFRALYPAQAVLGDWWLGKGRAALVREDRFPEGLSAPPTVQTEISLSPEEQSGPGLSLAATIILTPDDSEHVQSSYQWSGSGRNAMYSSLQCEL